ncbi:histidine kinase [Nocardioides sp. LHD-245]|uniref:sensor histidine kinase n=1 Tax=Nocardioides sp. LHD-245 TaxID=3051387 RepID=UPI0027DF4755|nr:histidine kinase [Nocardioides sp. LHD-245]
MTSDRLRSWTRSWRFLAVEVGASAGSLVLFMALLLLTPFMLLTGGVLVLPEAARLLRRWSDRARVRIGAFRGTPIAAPRVQQPADRTIDARLHFAFSRQTAREVGWLTIHALPTFTVGLVCLAIPLGILNSLLVPFYWFLVPADEPVVAPYPVTSWGLAATMPLVAVGYAVVSWYLVPAAARAVAAVSARLLTPDRRLELRARVDSLTLSRAAALDAHAAELRRIERDLHDGAQNRLVSVTMMMGLAERAFENGEDGLPHLRRAQEAASDALAGLRRTVHDIYPPILDELGLEGALASLAGRSVVPCTLELGDVGRVPAAVESATYFIVAEALNNVNKYSAADTARVRVAADRDLLHVEITDDGTGGAVERPGGGLAGMRRRVEAFEGRLTMTSPEGGPTTVRAELTCGS